MGFKGLKFDQQCNLINDITHNVLHQYCHDRYDINQIVDELYTGIDTTSEYIDNSSAMSCNKSRSSHCTSRLDDKLIQKIKLFAYSHDVPESILIVVSYLVIICLIKGESIVIESTFNNKSSVHFIHNFFSLSSLQDIINIITKQMKGPPSRVVKHSLSMIRSGASNLYYLN